MEEVAFYNLQIKSPSGLVFLGCDLHSCFSLPLLSFLAIAFSNYSFKTWSVAWGCCFYFCKGELEREECPSPGWDKTQAECLPPDAPDVFHNDYAFPAMNRYTRGSFSDLHPKNLWTPVVSHSQASLPSASWNLSKLLFKCSYQFMALVASAPGKQISAVFSIFTFLSRFWGGRSR